MLLAFWDFRKTCILGTQSRLAEKGWVDSVWMKRQCENSDEKEKFYFVLPEQQKKKAHEACIQCKQDDNNRTGSSERIHVVVWAVEKIISCNIQLQNGAPQHWYMLCEVVITFLCVFTLYLHGVIWCHPVFPKNIQQQPPEQTSFCSLSVDLSWFIDIAYIPLLGCHRTGGRKNYIHVYFFYITSKTNFMLKH